MDIEKFKAVVMRYLGIGDFFVKMTPNEYDDWIAEFIRGFIENTEILELIFGLIHQGVKPKQAIAIVHAAVMEARKQLS